jgi:hypothetical protein
MKRLVICLFAVYFLLGFSATASTTDDGKKTKVSALRLPMTPEK